MTAIAYISDTNMLEYHRLSGNTSAVFWRLSTKKFNDFVSGDLLFFLDGGVDNRRDNEKALVGYGCFKEGKVLKPEKVWEKYTTLTGYDTQKQFIEAISKNLTKIPDKISCLFLDDITFFATPIYLSDFNLNLSGNLESFTYLKKGITDLSIPILEKAKEIGVDLWTNVVGDNSEETFDKHIYRIKIKNVIERIQFEPVSRSIRYAQKCYKIYDDAIWTDRFQQTFLKMDLKPELNITYSDNNRNFTDIFGKLVYIKTMLDDSNIVVNLVTDVVFDDCDIELLEKFGVNYYYFEVE